MNEFEKILKTFGQMILALFSLTVSLIIFILIPKADISLKIIMGFGFVLIFILIIIVTGIELSRIFRRR